MSSEEKKQPQNPEPHPKQDYTQEQNPYEDIINLPRPVSKKHPPLTMKQRAAQFSPFAAVGGHTEAINKTARDREKLFE